MEKLESDRTGVNFNNVVESTLDFNILNYLYFYDGGGVTVGDLNNDGLPELFFVGNMVSNKLYLNKGDFIFEDITENAGFEHEEETWATGVTMADVNGDDYMDIYISRVNYLTKKGANLLYINNGDLTFTEKAADYGLDFKGLSTQAVFFDFNKSGRLDMILLNHSFHSDNTYGKADELRSISDPRSGDKLFRNDGDSFTDVTDEAGIISSSLGYGLGVAVSDINQDGWPDIYVGNDFHEDDYLYINNGDGTFTEALYSSIGHTSQASMGNDIADINNNGYVDIISLDMMPEDHEKYMRTSGSPDSQMLTDIKLDYGFGHQNARNTLQVNRGLNLEGIPIFSESAFLSGVAMTDWSWASLFMDLNNDGLKDLFITNGMVRQPNDLDYVRLREPRKHQDYVTQKELDSTQLMPTLKIPNYVFKNNGNLTFTNETEEWGLDQPTTSSGAAFADLNNNGRLDLIVNNVNMPSYIYRNNTDPDDSTANYLKVKLKGKGMNTSGIGSKVILYKDDQIFYQEQIPTRGFQSSVDHILHFGLGEIVQLDSLLVIWPDDSYQNMYSLNTNRQLELRQENVTEFFDYDNLHRKWDEPLMVDVTEEIIFEFQHRENSFNDYSREPLIPYKLSTQGPALAVGDVNGDGLDDVFIGGARDQASSLFIQKANGQFLASNAELFKADRENEDVDAVFFDATGNGLIDLYVVSGGAEFTGNDSRLKDRLFINEGDGEFKRSVNRLPDNFVNGAVVRPIDINDDGHIDLFVGGRSIPFMYGLSPKSFILINDGFGNFKDATEKLAPDLKYAGMVTDARWANISNDQYPDLVITAEWMGIQYFQNDGKNLKNISKEVGLENTNGLWQSLLIEDITGNGYLDIFAGNFGLNSRIQASTESPIRLFINDFDGNGQTSAVVAKSMDGKFFPFEQLDELSEEFNDLLDQINSYKDFSSRTIRDLFGDELINTSFIRQIIDLETSFFENDGNGSFIKKELPLESQFSPTMAIHSFENTETGGRDIILGGNLYDVRPSMGGRQDASYGLYLQRMDSGNFQSLEIQSSGFFTQGEVRGIREVNTSDGMLFLVSRNNDDVRFFKRNNK